MKYILLLIFTLILVQASIAQDKLTVGISIAPELTGQTASVFIYEKNRPAIGYTGAAEINYFPQKNFGIFTGVDLFQKRMKIGFNDNVNLNSSNSPVYATLIQNDNYFSNKLKEKYVEIPAGIILRTTPNKFSVYSSFGMSLGMILQQNNPIDNNSNENRKTLSKSVYNTNYLNGLAGAGIHYYLNKKWKVQGEVKVRYTFSNMLNFRNTPPASSQAFADYNNNAHTYSVGIKFGIIYVLM